MASFMGKIVLGDGTLKVVVDCCPYDVTKEHYCYGQLYDAVKSNDADKFLEFIHVVPVVESVVVDGVEKKTGIEFVDGEVYYEGKPINHVLGTTIKKLREDGFDFEPMLKFLALLLENPSRRSVEELYRFLESNGLTITEDGHFLAYKSVRSDYKDKYSGQFDNSVGAVMEVPRNQVDDDFRHECSHGFHVGGLAYSGPQGWYHNSGDKVLIVKVNPKDVVSVPADHNSQKVRVCRYEVVGEYKAPLQTAVYTGEVNGDYANPVATTCERFVADDELDISEVFIGEGYKFTYKGKSRYLLVEDIGEHTVMGVLLAPEEYEGQYRSFKMNEMSKIYEYNVEDYEEEDWDDDEDVEEEEGEDHYW